MANEDLYNKLVFELQDPLERGIVTNNELLQTLNTIIALVTPIVNGIGRNNIVTRELLTKAKVITSTILPLVENSLPRAARIAYCRIGLSTEHVITNSTPFTVPWSLEYYDENNMHDLTTNPERITITSTGNYVIDNFINWERNSTGSRVLRLYKNGTELIKEAIKEFPDVPNFPVESTIVQMDSTLVSLNNGDYLTLEVQQGSGGDLSILRDSWISVIELDPPQGLGGDD